MYFLRLSFKMKVTRWTVQTGQQVTLKSLPDPQRVKAGSTQAALSIFQSNAVKAVKSLWPGLQADTVEGGKPLFAGLTGDIAHDYLTATCRAWTGVKANVTGLAAQKPANGFQEFHKEACSIAEPPRRIRASMICSVKRTGTLALILFGAVFQGSFPVCFSGIDNFSVFSTLMINNKA